MHGQVFEDYIMVLLKNEGYKVNLTKTSGDFGADLIHQKDGIKTVVQTKRYSKKVGVRAVQEVIASKGYYDATEAWVVTNNYYTAPAIKLANVSNVKLIDREDLVKWILNNNQLNKSI